MPSNEIMSLEGQLCGIPLAGPESFSQQQLDYLKRALGVDETVLYDANGSPNQTGPWILSEARTNFKWIDIVLGVDASGNEVKVQRFKADSLYMKVDISRYEEDPNWKISTMTLSFNQTTMSIKSSSIARYMITSAGAVSASTAAAQAPYIYQVIGVGRIANN